MYLSLLSFFDFRFGCVLYNVILDELKIDGLNEEVSRYIKSMISKDPDQRPTDNESFFRHQILQDKVNKMFLSIIIDKNNFFRI